MPRALALIALPRPLRSAPFRFALLLAAVFAAGACALLVAVEQQIGSYAQAATDGRLRSEVAVLASEYGHLGRQGLIDAIARHTHAGGEAEFAYLLVDPQGRRLYGTLPQGAAREGRGVLMATEQDPDDVAPVATSLAALGQRLPGGLLLVVATDNFDVAELRHRLGAFTALCGMGIALFALVGGYLSGGMFLRRLDRVNRAVERIIEGDRAERLPMIGMGAEFDELALNLNRMIDRNEAATEALRQIASDIAHDLRTPLARLHQRLEQMKDQGTASPDMWDDALGQTRGLLETFHALLRIGAVEGGVGRRRFRAVDLSELMDRIYQVYQPVVEDSGQILLAEHAPGLVIEGDSELLAQMVTNLIENAMVHTPCGTTVRSRLYREGTSIVVTISDDGPGIPAAERSNVFRRFYRLDASRHTEGAGLGLALVAAIAGLHGATHEILAEATGFSIKICFAGS